MEADSAQGTGLARAAVFSVLPEKTTWLTSLAIRRRGIKYAGKIGTVRIVAQIVFLKTAIGLVTITAVRSTEANSVMSTGTVNVVLVSVLPTMTPVGITPAMK